MLIVIAFVSHWLLWHTRAVVRHFPVLEGADGWFTVGDEISGNESERCVRVTRLTHLRESFIPQSCDVWTCLCTSFRPTALPSQNYATFGLACAQAFGPPLCQSVVSALAFCFCPSLTNRCSLANPHCCKSCCHPSSLISSIDISLVSSALTKRRYSSNSSIFETSLSQFNTLTTTNYLL
jgi:hypothetical protein